MQNDYETKLLKIISDTEVKMAALEQKSHDNAASNQRAMFDHIQDLGKGVNELAKVLGKDTGEEDKAANDDDTLPPEAIQHLRPGRSTTFKNGSKWTMGEGGQPQRVT